MNSKSDNPNGGTRHGYEKGIKFSLAALVVAGALVGCGKAEDTTSKDTAKGSDNTKQELSGTIAAAGSTALLPLAEEAGKKFMEKNSKFLFKFKVAVVELGLTK